jgi:hypothetical protein
VRRPEWIPAVAAESIIPVRCLATAGNARRAVASDRTAAWAAENPPNVARSEAGGDGCLQSGRPGAGVTRHGATIEGRTRRLFPELAELTDYLAVIREAPTLQLGEDRTIVGHDLE